MDELPESSQIFMTNMEHLIRTLKKYSDADQNTRRKVPAYGDYAHAIQSRYRSAMKGQRTIKSLCSFPGLEERFRSAEEFGLFSLTGYLSQDIIDKIRVQTLQLLEELEAEIEKKQKIYEEIAAGSMTGPVSVELGFAKNFGDVHTYAIRSWITWLRDLRNWGCSSYYDDEEEATEDHIFEEKDYDSDDTEYESLEDRKLYENENLVNDHLHIGFERGHIKE